MEPKKRPSFISEVFRKLFLDPKPIFRIDPDRYSNIYPDPVWGSIKFSKNPELSVKIMRSDYKRAFQYYRLARKKFIKELREKDGESK